MEVRDSGDVPLQSVLDYLRSDATRNLFAIYDLLKERENTKTSLAMEGDKTVGYLLRYSGLSYRTAIIRGLRPAVARLLDELRGERMVLFVDSDALAMVEEKMNPTAVIKEDLMVVRAGQARLTIKNLAKRLGPRDAPAILSLLGLQAGARKEREIREVGREARGPRGLPGWRPCVNGWNLGRG